MKKIISLIIALAMLTCLFTVFASAEDRTYNFSVDAMDGKSSDWVQDTDTLHLTCDAAVTEGSPVGLLGWVASTESGLDKIQYKIDSGEWQDASNVYRARQDVIDYLKANRSMDCDATANDHPGFGTDGTHMTLDGVASLAAGTYTLDIRALLKDGSTVDMITANLTVNAAKSVDGTIIAAHDGTPSVWLGNNNPLSRSVSFNTTKGFSGISFPATWGIGGDGYTLTVTVEQGGAKVAEGTFTDVGDKGLVTVDFGKFIPAGDTTITVSIADGTYFVFSTLTKLADSYKLTYSPAGGNFAFDLVFAEAPAPQTGDVTVAMFAVIAVVALAAVVVLKKRVND